MEHMQIRMATIDDLDAITSVEADCFPPAEAATKEEFARRLRHMARISGYCVKRVTRERN